MGNAATLSLALLDTLRFTTKLRLPPSILDEKPKYEKFSLKRPIFYRVRATPFERRAGNPKFPQTVMLDDITQTGAFVRPDGPALASAGLRKPRKPVLGFAVHEPRRAIGRLGGSANVTGRPQRRRPRTASGGSRQR